MWYQLCECTSGTPVALPAAAAPPAGTAITTNSPQPVVSTCEPHASGTITMPSGTSVRNKDVFGHITPVFGPPLTIPAGATSLRLTATRTAAGSTHGQISFNIQYWNTFTTQDVSSSGVFSGVILTTGVQTNTWVIAVPATSQYWTATVQTVSDNLSDTGVMEVDFFCNGDKPGETQSPCCPPDETLRNTVDAILAMTTLLQRQLAPFSYVASTAHAGLTGNNTIAVQGLLGVKVDVTTLPARAGAAAGDPVTYFDLGWINLGTADGFGDRHFISSDPLLLLPISGAITVIGYSIPADVTVTITELVRES
jgi:hypothetical protein